MSASLLESINQNPLAGAIVAVILLLIHQIIKSWRGKTDASKLEQESNKLAKQTSETVNKCAERTQKVMEVIEKHIEKNDLGHISTKLNSSVQMLEKMVSNQSNCIRTLDGVASLCRSIADDLQKTDSRLVHQDIQNKVKGALDKLDVIIDEVKQTKQIILMEKK